MDEGAARDAVLGLYAEGVVAVADLAERAEWAREACGSWTAVEVVRHLAAVAGWYHAWLDRAEAGEVQAPFPPDELPRHNAEELLVRADQDPGDAVVEYVEQANRYADRLPDAWDRPYGFPLGTVTAGHHAAVAVAEWHLHAWDLARVSATDHRPSDPGLLMRAAGRCRAAARGGPVGVLQGRMTDLAARVGPWEQVLWATGRRPRVLTAS